MSTGGPQTPDTALLAQQIDAVAREQAALAAAASRGRAIRLLLLIALVAVAGFSAYRFYKLGDQLINDPKYHQKVLSAVETHWTENEATYTREVEKLYQESYPIVTDALVQQVKKDVPIYLKSLDKQRDELQRDLEKKLTTRLQGQYEKLMQRQQDTLRKEYPEAENPEVRERVQKNLELALNKVANKYYLEEMRTQVQGLLGLWDNFPTQPPPKGGEPSLEDQLTATLTNLLMYRIAHPNSWTLASTTP